MKKLYTILVLLFFYICSNAQSTNPAYDKQLADSLGADDYGMKMFFLVILKTGTNKIDDKVKTDSLFRGHMQNIRRLADMGKIVVAGPIKENEKTYRGIFIMNVKTLEEAKSLLESDPVIKEKVLATEIYEWYGSAAIPLVLKLHDKLAKQNF